MLFIHKLKPKLISLTIFLSLAQISIAATPNTSEEADSVASSPFTLAANSSEPKSSPADFSAFGGANTQEDSDDMWQALREQYFSDRPIIEIGENRVRLKVPSRAENDAMVPVLIDLKSDYKDKKDPFTKVYLVVDVNPLPMGGVFKIAKNRTMEQLKTSVRVNGYTYIRAIGETSEGKLYMSKQWVKSTGAGCSAPPGLDQAMHKKRLGKMRFKEIATKGETKSRALRLMISHPNNTGMQKDQVSTYFIPEHYVKHVNVTFNQDSVLEADINFTLSENPNFTFTFDPKESGVLKADMKDNLDNSFSLETEIKGYEIKTN